MNEVSIMRGMFEWGIIWVVPGLAFCFMALGIMVAVLWLFRPKKEITGIERYERSNKELLDIVYDNKVKRLSPIDKRTKAILKKCMR